MKTTQEKIAVMQAFEEGKPVRWNRSSGGCGVSKKTEGGKLDWGWESCDYEIVQEEPKPEPAKAREWWLHLAGTDVVLYGQLSCGHPSDVLVREVLPDADAEFEELRAECARLAKELTEAREVEANIRHALDHHFAVAREIILKVRRVLDGIA